MDDTLDTLAKRVRDRENRSRKDQLEHAKKQSADVLAARTQAKRGQWGPWCEKAGLGQPQAWRYAEFGKVCVTHAFSQLTEDGQWEEWQRIQGNAPDKDNEEGQETAGDTEQEDSDENPKPAREFEWFTEMKKIRDWLLKRQLEFPEAIRPQFAKLARHVVEHLEDEDVS